MLIYRKYYNNEDYNNDGMAVEPDDRDGMLKADIPIELITGMLVMHAER
jgi:hypothetical protein